MRIKNVITKDKMSSVDVYTNSPNWYHKKCMDNSKENMHVDTGA